MNILLFLISIIFWSIFYLFYLISDWSNIYFNSLSWNLLIESVSFILIWFFAFIWFSNFNIEKKENNKDKIKLDFSYFVKIIQIFFKKYLYYLWLILAYSSIYFILKYYWYSNFSYFILILNLIVLILFLTKKNFLLFRDFIKINTIIFSLYYIIVFILTFFDKNLILSKLDIINTILILVFFWLTLYNDKVLKNKKSDLELVSNLYVYIYLYLIYYIKLKLNIFSISLLCSSTFLVTFIYFLVTKIKFFNNSKIILNIISIIISYISIIISFYILYNQKYIILWVINIVYLSFFNYFIHYRYQNYVSLFFSIFWFIFLIFYFYFNYLFKQDSGFMFLWLWFFLAWEFIIYTYFYDLKYKTDYYFLYIISYLISFFVIVYYFYAFSFDLLTLGIILLLSSFIALGSYFKLKKININN